MPRKSNRNLRVHNIFTLGPQQPMIPCSHPDCPRYFFSRAGRSNHMRAAHSPNVSLPEAPNSPQAPVQPSSPKSGPNQSPPLSPFTFHFPSSLSSHEFEPVLNKDSPIWHNIRSSSPAYSSESPSEGRSRQSSEHPDSLLGDTPLNSDVDFEFPPVDFTPFSDAESLPEDSMGMDVDPTTPSSSQRDSTSRSKANFPRASTVGSDVGQTPTLPSHAVDDNSSSSPGTEVPPRRVRRVYHRQMNGKHLLSSTLIQF